MPLGPVQQFAVDANMITRRIGLRAQLRHHLPVHHHAPGNNHLLGAAPAGNARRRENLLQALEFRRRPFRLFATFARRLGFVVLACFRSRRLVILGLAPRARLYRRLRCFHPRPGFENHIRGLNVRRLLEHADLSLRLRLMRL
jgi:hypothetical protein